MDVHLGNKVRILVLFILLISFKALSQEHWPLYDITNTRWQPADTAGSYYLILKNNKSCLECYKKLSDFFSQSAPTATVYCVTISDSSVLGRKLNYKQTIQLMPNLKTVLFDYENVSGDILMRDDLRKSSPFYEYNVDITPALIKVENGYSTYYSYMEVFNNGNINLNLNKQLFDN